jgi:hypothetical protein
MLFLTLNHRAYIVASLHLRCCRPYILTNPRAATSNLFQARSNPPSFLIGAKY